MTILYAGTLLVSSALLFLVQPLCGKMVLPLLGGTPSVWNTCMVFFQAGLLAGYAYAHAGPAWLGSRRHALVHLGLLGLGLLVLPFSFPVDVEQAAATSPFLWLFLVLLTSVGFPFVMVASSGPLLQKWFAGTGSDRARDPYFLYAASNFGSLAGLLSYPFLVEPNITLSEQRWFWSLGYGALIVLTLACAVPLWLSRSNPSAEVPDISPEPSSIPDWKIRLRWLLLALVPSSLMLSVTTYLTTDIAAIPLLWVLPLGLYLLTYTLAFATRQVITPAIVARWLPLVLLTLAAALLSQATDPVWLLLIVNLTGLFWIALGCHTELARTRPAARYLTGFYLWLALGGVLGGLFNALLAPLLFSGVAEYPIMLVVAALIRPAATTPEPRWSWKDVALPVLLGLFTLALVRWGPGLASTRAAPQSASPVTEHAFPTMVLILPVPALLCYLTMNHRLRFGLALAAYLLAGSLYEGYYGTTLLRVRSFFGAHRVTMEGGLRKLVHGGTVHGLQGPGPYGGRAPLAYYHSAGPAGEVFGTLRGDPRLERVALVGLGAGALAAYAEPGQHWTFFEIDPAVVYLARDSGWFHFLREASIKPDIVLGDARLNLARSKQRFGVIVLDAFSSDAIPLHLLTREALEIYRSRLEPGGLLVFHVSNRYLELEPVLANLAKAANPPMVGIIKRDQDDKLRQEGKFQSEWVVLANHPTDLDKVTGNRFWVPLKPRPELPVWTDDFSNLFQALRRREE